MTEPVAAAAAPGTGGRRSPDRSRSRLLVAQLVVLLGVGASVVLLLV